jgi:hypothetical protein
VFKRTPAICQSICNQEYYALKIPQKLSSTQISVKNEISYLDVDRVVELDNVEPSVGQVHLEGVPVPVRTGHPGGQAGRRRGRRRGGWRRWRGARPRSIRRTHSPSPFISATQKKTRRQIQAISHSRIQKIKECKKWMAIFSLGPVGQREPAITPQSYEEGSPLLLAKEEMRFYLSLSVCAWKTFHEPILETPPLCDCFCRRSARDIGT